MGRRGVRRGAVAGLATIVLSTVLVLAPAPRWAMAEEMAVRTVHVDLVRSTVDRTGQAVATAGLAATEATELLDARQDRARVTTGTRARSVRAVGVTLPSAPAGPVLVRGRVDGTWTPWLEVPFLDGESPDAGAESADVQSLISEPVWLGEADAYEFDAPPTTPALDVHEVFTASTTRRLAIGDVASAAGAPSILSRASWGARPPNVTPTTTADLKLAIVHHTVSGNSYTASQVPAVLRSIQAYHQDARGFDDIAYNFVVDRFGRTWEGRAGGVTNVVVGGHSQGFNTGSTGVVALGDYRFAVVTSAMFESIARVIAWKFALHKVDPRSTVPFTSHGSAKYPEGQTVTLRRVVGHGDVQATSCPGNNLIARLPALRERVAQLVPSFQADVGPALLAPDLNGDQLTDPFEYRAGAGGDRTWFASPSGAFTKVSSPVSGTYRPAIGDFDGNGVDDVLWYGTGLAPDTVWYFRTDRTHRAVQVRQDLITGVPLVGDFDGDQRDDVLFYGPGSEADDWLWWSTGPSFKVVDIDVTGRYLPAVHDATGDGSADITWLNPGATTSSRWSFSASRVHSSRVFSHSAVTGRPQVGDFDGDGREDLLTVAPGSARDAVWYSTPTGIDARSVTLTGTYGIATGIMDSPPLLSAATTDVLFVSNGADTLWRGGTDRTFSSSRVG